jgi:hypothetical protein
MGRTGLRNGSLRFRQLEKTALGSRVDKPMPAASQPKITPPIPPTNNPPPKPIPAINPPPTIKFIGPYLLAARSPNKRPITIAAEKQMYGKVETNGVASKVSRARIAPQSPAEPSPIAAHDPSNPTIKNSLWLLNFLLAFNWVLIKRCR